MLIGVSISRAQALTDDGQKVPKLKRVRALIDTGASSTCLDPLVFAELGLQPTGTIPILTPSTGAVPVEASTYDVSIVIPAGAPPHLLIETIAVSACELFGPQGIHALLGRDILQRCLLVFNAGAGTFSFAY
jgi:predicted aspartyl protease